MDRISDLFLEEGEFVRDRNNSIAHIVMLSLASISDAVWTAAFLQASATAPWLPKSHELLPFSDYILQNYGVLPLIGIKFVVTGLLAGGWEYGRMYLKRGIVDGLYKFGTAVWGGLGIINMLGTYSIHLYNNWHHINQ